MAEGDKLNAEFLGLERDWWRALHARDWDAARAFMRDDFSITSAGWIDAPVGREAWLASLDERYVLDEFDYDDLVARKYGPVAVVQCRSHQSGRFRETQEAWTATFRYTDVWVLEGDRWQVAVRHAGMRPG